jgi:hypothetical protein
VFVLGGNGTTLFLDTNNLQPAGSLNNIVAMSGNQAQAVYTLRNATGNNGAIVSGFSTGTPSNLLFDTSTTNNLKGGLNIIRAGTTPYGPMFTLVDTGQGKTLANKIKRPSADATDTWIGNDASSTSPLNVGLAFGAPVSISNYISALPNGFNSGWLERLSASKKEFGVQTQFDTYMTSLIGCLGCGPFGLTGTQISDTFARADGPLGANWTTVSGTCSISGFKVVMNPGGGTYTQCNYTGSSFNNDQYAQATTSAPGQFVGVGVRLQGGAVSGYYFFCGAGTSLILQKLVAGVPTNLGTSGCAVGDILKLTISGSSLFAYKNGVQVFTATDTTFTSGSPGVIAVNTSPPGFVNNFFAGNADWQTVQPIGTVVAQTVQTGSPSTFSTLASCAGATEGTLAAVTDSTTAVWGATITGGGANHVLAYCDGTNWTVTAK